jgi:hypothetical protein
MRWFASNIRKALLAFVLAVSVWVSAVTSADPNEVRSPLALPLEIVGQDPSLIITGEIPRWSKSPCVRRARWEQITAGIACAPILDSPISARGEHTADIQIQIE